MNDHPPASSPAPSEPIAPTGRPPAAADASPVLPEESPSNMLDVHPPHEEVHSWKSFFIHIATIVIGLLIAVGLEQTVEYFHHRHQLAETREALAVERRGNVASFVAMRDEFHRFVPKLKTNLAIFDYLRKHPNAAPSTWPGKLDWLTFSTVASDVAWRTAQQSGVLQYMPIDEVQRTDELYRRLTNFSDRVVASQQALNIARRFAILDPDPSHLTPAELDREIDLTLDVLLQFALIGRVENNIASRFSDFHPALGRKDVYGVLNASTDPDDQRAIEALQERIDRAVREQPGDETSR